MSDLGRLPTEGRADALADLDLRPTAYVVGILLEPNRAVVAAVEAAGPAIAALADAAAARLGAGGRLVYAGAGAAGWTAFVDASELGPTFGLDAVALVAGAEHPTGSHAEAAAEDDAAAGAAAVRALEPTAADVLVAVSASGRTPYALGALDAARAAGALTGAVVCTADSPLARGADLAVEALVGPEVVAGSTRMKAGTAQKLVLNAFSTAVAIRRGRTLGDLMTSMRVANEKLRDRAARITQAAAGCDERTARAALAAAGDEIPVAVLIAAHGADPPAARARLDAANGNLRRALAPPHGTAGPRSPR